MALASDMVAQGQNPDDALWVRFYNQAVQNNFRSEKEGHPCFDDVLFISVISPGDAHNKIDRKATEQDKQRFHKQWANFKAGNAEKIEGTPIIEWPAITRSQSEELKFLGVLSIEQLALASDAQVQKIMGGVSLREKAKAFLSVASNTAEAQKAAAENVYLREQIEALKSQIAALGAKVESTAVNGAQENTKPRRGRPPKVKTPTPA